MEYVFTVWATSLLLVATVGFLVLEGFVGHHVNICKERLEKLIHIQSYANACFDKAKSYGDFAALVEMHEATLRTLGASVATLKREQEIAFSFNRDVYIQTILTLQALEVWNPEQTKRTLEEVGTLPTNVQTSNNFNRFHVEQTLAIVAGSHRFGEKIDKARREFADLEFLRRILWYGFFALQTVGLVCGFIATLLVRQSIV